MIACKSASDWSGLTIEMVHFVYTGSMSSLKRDRPPLCIGETEVL